MVDFSQAENVVPTKKRAPRARGRRSRAAFSATITVELGAGAQGRRRAESMSKALAPETGRGLPGSSVRLRRPRSGSLELVIEADSLATLRAAVNSYLRWAALAHAVAEVADSRQTAA